MFSTIAMSKVTKVILEEILKKMGKNKKCFVFAAINMHLRMHASLRRNAVCSKRLEVP
jgi:hypothetical protein